VGADRKGPLAAFVVIAIIAAVLLVTSVRSQAAPGWLRPDKLPASVVAAPVTEPHLWGAVSGGVHQVVQDGVVLAKRATSGPSSVENTTTEAVVATSSVAGPPATGDSGPSETHQVVPTRHAVRHPHHTTSPHRPAHHDAPSQPADEPTGPAAPATDPATDPATIPPQHDHGRHPGWSNGHGHDVAPTDAADPADPADAADPAELPTSEHGHGHGHAQGHGHAHGHDHGHDHGHRHGHGHGHGHGESS
jgi:hypothetical protein